MIYETMITKDYECVGFVGEPKFDLFRDLDGSSVINHWPKIIIDFGPTDKGQKSLHSDFPWLGAMLIVRQRVVDCMGDLLKKHAELLPVFSEEGEKLFALNCKRLDVVDLEKSDIQLLSKSNKIFRIKKYVFYEDTIKDKILFKTNTLRGSPTFVNSDFVTEYNKHGFVGLDFIPIYKESWDTSFDIL